MNVREWSNADDSESGLMLWCPGCQEAHSVRTRGGEWHWDWDGSLDQPTITPSLLVGGVQWAKGEHFHKSGHAVAAGNPIICHSFIRVGQWEFLADSTHNLAGHTVPMVPFPDYWS